MLSATGDAETAPQAIRIDDCRKLIADGQHNGFTDLARFQDTLYLAYRSSPSGHGIHDDSRIVILCSRDGQDWTPSFNFHVPGRDVRDPHFLVFQDKLFVYSGTWDCTQPAPDLHHHLGYAAWTCDGVTWHGPAALPQTRGYYIWRAAAHAGVAYLGGRGGHPPGPMLPWRREILFTSVDGLNWQPSPQALHETEGSETALLFEPDGALLALSRGLNSASLCQAVAPYQTWTRTALNCFLGGPMLVRWGSRILVGARRRRQDGTTHTVLSWLVNQRLVDVLELPSGGDNGYTGFVPLSDDTGLLSYYSSHEGSGTLEAPSHIYLARLRVTADTASVCPEFRS